MHDRNLNWQTAKGETIKIKNMEASHLENVLKHIDNNMSVFVSKFGKSRTDMYKNAIQQEIRFRKLNRLNNEDNENLF